MDSTLLSILIGTLPALAALCAVVSATEMDPDDYNLISLAPPWSRLLGGFERSTRMVVHGPAGAGKSTAMISLARQLVPHAQVNGGTVLYVGSEEGHGYTMAEKLERMGADDHPLLRVSNASGLEEIKEDINHEGAEFVVLDSATVADPGRKEAEQFLKWVKRQGIGFIAILHETKEGRPKGSTHWSYDPDVRVRVEKEGEEHIARTMKNRYHPLTTTPVPMTEKEIAPPIPLDQARRENPNCDQSPQSEQCRALFRQLQKSGEYDPVKAGERSVSQGSDSKGESDSEPREEPPIQEESDEESSGEKSSGEEAGGEEGADSSGSSTTDEPDPGGDRDQDEDGGDVEEAIKEGLDKVDSGMDTILEEAGLS